MKFNKTLFVVLVLGFLQGQSLLAHAAQSLPERIYERLGGELGVELMTERGPLVGVAVWQKNNPAGSPAFCRRTSAVVPNPVYSYECFYRTLTGDDAEALYSGSNAQALTAVFRDADGGALLGRSWQEKSIGSDDAAICVKTEPVVPNATAHYTCYSHHGAAGGAISGGN